MVSMFEDCSSTYECIIYMHIYTYIYCLPKLLKGSKRQYSTISPTLPKIVANATFEKDQFDHTRWCNRIFIKKYRWSDIEKNINVDQMLCTDFF